ncbi:MAG: mRNA surveillance protein pelota [Candidatus Altiarchaeota archaeon]|nr:mRNA surveillance protein pelota [Candidatus Altiarchaeota archaeon]
MKIFYKDLRHGRVKLGVENLDDLWYLSNIISSGDLVKAKTERRLKAKEDMARAGKSERVTVTIALRVEKADFRAAEDAYRISGVIEEGPEDLVSVGSHHTINVEKDTVLTITKDRWRAFELDRIRDAEKSALRPKLLIVVIDTGEAVIALVRESRIEYFDLSKIIGGKYETKGRQERKREFYKEAAEFISGILGKENVSTMVIAGAGFEKENFHGFLAEKYPDIAAASILENIGSHGRAGVSEVMKRSKVRSIEEEVNAARDVKFMDKVLGEIGKESGLAAYGTEDIEAAAGMGAIELLLVCDDRFMASRKRIEPVMQNVKSSKGMVHIVNHDGDAGRQLTSLGGVAAVLRFRIQ